MLMPIGRSGGSVEAVRHLEVLTRVGHEEGSRADREEQHAHDGVDGCDERDGMRPRPAPPRGDPNPAAAPSGASSSSAIARRGLSLVVNWSMRLSAIHLDAGHPTVGHAADRLGAHRSTARQCTAAVAPDAARLRLRRPACPTSPTMGAGSWPLVRRAAECAADVRRRSAAHDVVVRNPGSLPCPPRSVVLRRRGHRHAVAARGVRDRPSHRRPRRQHHGGRPRVWLRRQAPVTRRARARARRHGGAEPRRREQPLPPGPCDRARPRASPSTCPSSRTRSPPRSSSAPMSSSTCPIPRRSCGSSPAPCRQERPQWSRRPSARVTWGSEHAGPPPNEAHCREWSLAELRELLAEFGMTHITAGVTRSNDERAVLATIVVAILPDDAAAARCADAVLPTMDAVTAALVELRDAERAACRARRRRGRPISAALQRQYETSDAWHEQHHRETEEWLRSKVREAEEQRDDLLVRLTAEIDRRDPRARGSSGHGRPIAPEPPDGAGGRRGRGSVASSRPMAARPTTSMRTAIVIPHHNQSGYLPEALAVATAQHATVVVVDDASDVEDRRAAQRAARQPYGGRRDPAPTSVQRRALGGSQLRHRLGAARAPGHRVHPSAGR